MTLALGATAITLAVLAWQLALPRLRAELTARRTRADAWPTFGELDDDHGRELRAERRARELLRSCVNEEEWSMYRALGFLRVWSGADTHAYLIYPHRPILAYRPDTGRLLGEYCVEFPDETRPYGSSKLPASDDVLAKWMTLTAEEERLITDANMHLPGRQIPPHRVRRDLARLAQWESERVVGATRAVA